MSIRNALSTGLAASILAGATILPGSAATIAQFAQSPATSGSSVFQLTGAASPGQILSTINPMGTPVQFFFRNDPTNPTNIAPALFDLPISATLTLTATSNSPAFPGTSPSENFGSATFSFKANGAQVINGVNVANGANLLTAVSMPMGAPFTATLSGTNTGTPPPGSPGSATFSGSDVTVPLNTVMYSSDFINFAGATGKGYSYSFSSVLPFYGVAGAGPTASINPFTAGGTGTFSAFRPAAVPEPGAVSLLAGLGMAGSVIAFRKRRRA